jgi:hypothetical protein
VNFQEREMNSQELVRAEGGPAGRPPVMAEIGAGRVLAFHDVDALVRQAAGLVGVKLGHVEYGRTATFDTDGSPAPSGHLRGRISVVGEGGRFTVGPVLCDAGGLTRLGVQVPEPPEAPAAPVPAPTLEERVRTLEATVQAIQRRQAWL